MSQSKNGKMVEVSIRVPGEDLTVIPVKAVNKGLAIFIVKESHGLNDNQIVEVV